MPPPSTRDLLDNFRCDPVAYQRQIQGKNGTFYDQMNVNQAVVPVPINGDNNMHYSSYTGTYTIHTQHNSAICSQFIIIQMYLFNTQN